MSILQLKKLKFIDVITVRLTSAGLGLEPR